MSKVTAYPPITNVQPADVLLVVDVLDTTMAATGTDKKITLAQVHSPGVAVVDWVNAVTQYGADPSGGADSTYAINNALSSGWNVYLPKGTYKVNGATALTMTIAGTRLFGAGWGATFISIGSSFTPAEAISVAAAWCSVRDMGIIGASGTTTSNPACNGIELTGYQHCTFDNLWFQHVNGWCIESSGGSSTANLDTMIGKIVSRNCAGGVHVKGVTGSSYGAEHFLTDIQVQQCGVTSGANAGLDGLLIEDANDVLVQGLNVGMASGATGSPLHIKGACGTVAVTNPDVGSSPASGNSAALHIESSANGSPSGVTINGGSVEGGGPAIQVDAGSDITLNGVRAHSAWTDGLQVNGSAVEVMAVGCSLASNNQGAGTGYDINCSSMTGGNFRAVACRTETVIGTGTAGNVTNPVAASVHSYFLTCFFIASNNTPSTTFTGTPQQVVNCLGYNPRGAVTAPAVGTSPYTPSGYQTPLQVIFTAVNSMISFAIAGTAVGVLPVAGVPYNVGVREAMTVTWAQTTVAAGSNGGEISTIATWGATYGGNGVLDVATTTGWPASGTVNVAASGSTTAVVTYTGISGNTLTGCTYVSGSATGTVSAGGTVALASGAPTWQWFGL